MRQDHVGLQGNHLFRKRAILICAGSSETIVDMDIAPLNPFASFESLAKCRESRCRFWIALGISDQHADARHPLALLRPRRERPRGRPAHERDEFPPFHSITSSAVICMISGTVRPSALAVLRLITSSNLVGCTTGRSAGFAPLRMCPV